MFESILRMLALARKEFLAILKDPRSRVVLFLPPIMQSLIFGYAASYDMTDVPYAVLDRDRTASSRALLAHLDIAVLQLDDVTRKIRAILRHGLRLVAICRALVADACSLRLRRGTRTGTRPRLRAVARPGTGVPAVTPMSLRRAARLHR